MPALALIAVVVGETCATPNDGTLVGKADEKVGDHHSPPAGTWSKASCFEIQKLDALKSQLVDE